MANASKMVDRYMAKTGNHKTEEETKSNGKVTGSSQTIESMAAAAIHKIQENPILGSAKSKSHEANKTKIAKVKFPKQFANLIKGTKVKIHLYNNWKTIVYIGVIEEDMEYLADSGLPKQVKIRITHDFKSNREENNEGKIMIFLYAKIGKKDKMAWVPGKEKKNKKTKIIEIKRDYSSSYKIAV